MYWTIYGLNIHIYLKPKTKRVNQMPEHRVLDDALLKKRDHVLQLGKGEFF